VFADVTGRPLGLAFDADGNLLVANHGVGLQSVSPDGTVRVLATEAAGHSIRFANDLVIASDGTVWFTDSSARYHTASLGDVPSYLIPDLVDGRASGRLLRYQPGAGEAEEVLDGLYFPNGIALTADERALWIAESTRYRILRYDLAGERVEHVVDDLPGVPDNLNRDRAGRMLVALYDRTDALDRFVLPTVLGRQLMIRLPSSWFVSEDNPLSGGILVLDERGQVELHATGLTPAVTSVVPDGDSWYLGSLQRHPLRSTVAP
jgi:sugar lactone lactonase YvrE